MELFFGYKAKDGHVILGEEEARHCAQVLRKKIYDEIHVTDGDGNKFHCKIISIEKTQVIASILSHAQCRRNEKRKFHLVIAPTKNQDRLEWMVEKCVELGVNEISLIICRHSERKIQKTDRLKKIAISAMKQSGQCMLTKINEPVPFSELVEKSQFSGLRYIAHCREGEKLDFRKEAQKIQQDILLLIGPEGDFHPEEIKLAEQNQFKSISLGETRLRTETAGLFATAIISSR